MRIEHKYEQRIDEKNEQRIDERIEQWCEVVNEIECP